MAIQHNISLILKDVSLSRGSQPLIEGLSVSIRSGEALWLTGPNGIGKTTLLLACADLLRPDSGQIIWQTRKTNLSANRLVAFAAHQGPERAELTLGEELAFWQSIYKDKNSLADRVQAVGLDGREQIPVQGLSAGQKRRLSLARLLSSNRPIWLMDEPLAGLDTNGQTLVTTSLSAHLSAGGLALIASHQPLSIDGVSAKKLILERPVAEAAS